MEVMATTPIPTVPTRSERSQRPPNITVSPDEDEAIQRQGNVLFYRMDRHIRTVTDFWREWTVGLHGNPSIMVLDRQWGSQWRSKRGAEQQWYSLRNEVIKEIRYIAVRRQVSEETAVQDVDLAHQASKKSLDGFCKALKVARKQRE
jgi:hypothetical protein